MEETFRSEISSPANTNNYVVETIEQPFADVGTGLGDRIGGGGTGLAASIASLPPSRHRRNVSWGRNDTILHLPTNLAPPARIGRQKSDTSGLSVEQDFHLPYTSDSLDSIRPPRKLTDLNLDALTRNNPIEEEAEAILIRALEKREPTMQNLMMEPSSNSVLGGNFPDATVDAMTKNGTADDAASATPPRNITAACSSDHDDDSIPSQKQSNATPRGGGGAPRGGRHRRVQTMEQQLYGLSTAIDAVHTNHPGTTISFDTNSNDEPGPGSRANTWDLGGGGVEAIPEDIPEPKSSADALAQNASILFRRANPKYRPDGGDDTRHQDDTSVDSRSNNQSLFRRASARNINYRPDGGDDSRQHDDTSVDNHSNIQGSVSTASSAIQNWRKLRETLTANGGIHPKKTDEIESPYKVNNANTDVAIDLEMGTEVNENEKSSKVQEVDNASNGHSTNMDGTPVGQPPTRRFRFIPGGLMFEEWKFGQEFQDYIHPIKGSIRIYLRIALFYLAIPALGIAAILFYLAGNPPIGILANNGKPDADGKLFNTDGEQISSNVASYSWWLLFLCVRQVVTFSAAKLMEMIVIDFFSIRLGVTFKMFGAWPTLFIMQSKGKQNDVVVGFDFDFYFESKILL
jgi:hypothetical protein